jgi:RNA polymerase sigma-70 factor (ECF subfamily)
MIFDINRKHFEQTVRAYSADLYRFAVWLCRDRFVAEDLVQETFTRAWKNWSNLRDISSVKPWLITILRNEHARLYERKQLEIADVELDDVNVAADHEPASAYDMERLVEKLPLSLREPLLLQVLGGFSCKEIAGMLDTTEGAVMTRLTRARQGMRRLLQDTGERSGGAQ